MGKFKIIIEGEVENLDELKALVMGGCPQITGVAEPEPVKPKAAPSKPKAAAKPAPEPEPAKPAEAPSEPEPAVPAGEAAPSASLEDIRKLISENIDGHREDIKAKLVELGATKASNLDPSKYGEMYEFLKAL